VHFLRFELSEPMVKDFKSGASVAIGIDHPAYRAEVALLAEPVHSALQADLA
jgi:hypothetical protein